MTYSRFCTLVEQITENVEPRDVLECLEDTLHAVVQATGTSGDAALEAYAAARAAEDASNAG